MCSSSPRTSSYDGLGDVSPNYIPLISTCGYSPVAIIFTVILGGLMTLVLPILGLRRLKSNIPVTGGCSAAISAACHPPESDKEAAHKRVMWGETIQAFFLHKGDNTASPQTLPPPPRLLGEETDNDNVETDVPFPPHRAHCTFTSQGAATIVYPNIYMK